MAREDRLDDSELLTGFNEGGPVEYEFETALRGYDKGQVKRFLQQMQLQMDTLAGERAEAVAQIDRLVIQIQQLQAQIQELRRRSAAGDKASYRHLGVRIEHMLTLAEEQAEEIKANAQAQTQHLHHHADNRLREAEAQIEQARKDFETTLKARRAAAEKAEADRRAIIDAEINKRAREAQAMLDQAKERSAALVAEAEQDAENKRAAADEQTRQLVAHVERDDLLRQLVGGRAGGRDDELDGVVGGSHFSPGGGG